MIEGEELFIKHILESIYLIESYVEELSAEEFLEQVEKQDAVIRRLEIIGEAVKNLSSGFREAHPQIPWQQIAGMRDLLIHKYFGVDLELTWGVVQRNLPELKQKLLMILAETT